MCGLAGVMAKYVQDKHRKIFQELMLGASLRGMHSSGLAAITKAYNSKDADYSWDKCVGNPLSLFERKAADSVLKSNSLKALIGHCRSATIGSISRANAHPFQTDSRMMIGCHNGTIRGTQPNEKYYGTDSECLLNNIDEYGIQDILPETSGAWALTYFNCKDNTMNFIRNSERTLYFAAVAKDNELYWTSEYGLLKWILDRNGVKYDDIVLLKTDTLVSIDITKDDPMAKDNIVFTEIKGKEESRTAASTTHFPAVRQQRFNQQTKSWEDVTPRTEATPKAQEQQTEVISNGSSESETKTKTSQTGQTNSGESGLRKSMVCGTDTSSHLTHLTYSGKRVSKGRFQQLLEMGCLNCEVVKKIGDEVHFYADNVYLCKECNEVPLVRETVSTKIGEYVEAEYDEAIEKQFAPTCN